MNERMLTVQVSLSLQDRLGLAKVRYERRCMKPPAPLSHGSKRSRPSVDNGDLASSPPSTSRYQTPVLSSPGLPPTLSRSAHSKHAATFSSDLFATAVAQSQGSRKRPYQDSGGQPSKVRRIALDRTQHGLHSSPHYSGPRPEPDVLRDVASSPPLPPQFPSDLDLELPALSSSMLESSSPRTPPNRPRSLLHGGRFKPNEGPDPGPVDSDATMLLSFAASPTPIRFSNPRTTAYPPSTPPSQHAVLPLLSTPTPGHGQPLNFADFVNVTPSPAQRPFRTPGTAASTARAQRLPGKGVPLVGARLNFDALGPSVEAEDDGRDHNARADVLQLGEEIRS